jgi:hypothetical protein
MNILNIIKEEIENILDEDLYHGSPYDFEEFLLDKIGSGEGAQAFGWGLYFTELEGIAKHYAETLKEVKSYIFNTEMPNYYNESNLHPKIKKIAEDVIKEMPNGVYKKNNIPFINDGIGTARLILQKTIGLFGGTFNTEYINLDERINDSNYTYKKYGYHTALGMEALLAKKLIENGMEVKINKFLYYIKFKNNKSLNDFNWLEWDKPINENQKEQILNGFKKENYSGRVRFVDGEFYIFYSDTDKRILDKGKEFYRALAGDKNYTEKKTSLFLLSVGIDGIKFPAESIARGMTSENARGFNYVIFDPSIIKIEQKTKYN